MFSFFRQKYFFVNFDFKNGCKMNSRIITKNLGADLKIRSPEKNDFRANGTHEFHPIVKEKKILSSFFKVILGQKISKISEYGKLKLNGLHRDHSPG